MDCAIMTTSTSANEHLNNSCMHLLHYGWTTPLTPPVSQCPYSGQIWTGVCLRKVKWKVGHIRRGHISSSASSETASEFVFKLMQRCRFIFRIRDLCDPDLLFFSSLQRSPTIVHNPSTNKQTKNHPFCLFVAYANEYKEEVTKNPC